MNPVEVTLPGGVIALIIATTTIAVLWWMMHPPASSIQRMAAEAESELKSLVGSIIVVFSPEIASAHMMALAAKLARGERSALTAIYVIEVPYTLPPDAEMPEEERLALDALGTAETIAQKNDVDLSTEVLKSRSTSQAVLDYAKSQKANIIILGSYREGKYTGAPLSRTIEFIAANAKCDVLIGVEGKHGTLLVDETGQATGTGSAEPRT